MELSELKLKDAHFFIYSINHVYMYHRSSDHLNHHVFIHHFRQRYETATTPFDKIIFSESDAVTADPLYKEHGREI